MTDEWWEHGYAGGPMVKVKGFPRPLYPPDANKQGKKPSREGPDVEGYKRTVSRAGRWPWQEFDQAYSNGFAHGTSGNVVDTGVAGVQRQQHIDDTGWLGEKTFNTLRSIRVPEGKPNAGEMAMDSYAASLIDKAFDMFGGHEPSDGQGSVRNAALTRAKSQIGVVESPAGSNNQKYGVWYGMNGVPWCAIFVSWDFVLGAQDIAKHTDTFAKGAAYSYVPYILADAAARRNGLSIITDPEPGDLVLYDWEGNGEYDHIGIFEKWTGGTSSFDAVEGNTSTSNNSNGGQVMRRSRSRGGQATTFVRVAEP
jgi:CHAP domain-containing protein